MKVDPSKGILAWVRLRDDVPAQRPTLGPLVALLGGAPVVLVGEPDMAPIDGDQFLPYERIFRMAGPESVPVRVLVYGQAYAVVERAANQTSADAARAWLSSRSGVRDLRWGNGPSRRDESKVVVQVPVWMLLPVSGASKLLVGGRVDPGPHGFAGLAIADADVVTFTGLHGQVEMKVKHQSGERSWAEDSVVATVQITDGGGAQPGTAGDAAGSAAEVPAEHDAPPAAKTPEPVEPADPMARAISAADAVVHRPPVSADVVPARVDGRFIEAVLLGLVQVDRRDDGWAWLAGEVRLDDAVVLRAARTLGMRWGSDRDRLVALGLLTERAFGVGGVTVEHLRLVRQLTDAAAAQKLSRDWGGLRGLVALVRYGGLGSDLEVRILLELLAGANRAKDRVGLDDLVEAWARWEYWLLPGITSDKLTRFLQVWSLGPDPMRVVEPDVGVALAYLVDAGGRPKFDGFVMPEDLGVSPAVQLAAIVQALREVAGWGHGVVELRPIVDDVASSPEDPAASGAVLFDGGAVLSDVEAVSAHFDLRITGDQGAWRDWLSAVVQPRKLARLGERAWWLGPGEPPRNAVEVLGYDEVLWVYRADARGLPVLDDGVVMPGLGLSPAVGLVATVQALRVVAGWGASRVRLWPVFDDAVRSPRDVAAARALLSTVEVVSANLGVPIGADDRAWWVPARRPPNTALFAVVGEDRASSVFDVGIAAANLSGSNPADDIEDPNQSGFVGFNNGGSLTKSSGGAVVVSIGAGRH